MPIFDRANNVVVHDGTFMDFSQVVTGESGIDILRKASIPEAAHDSEARHPAPSCFPGTRTQYIEDITQWAHSEGPTFPLHWVKGPAGVGKSAVAQTVTERLKDFGQLGAAFFWGGAGGYDQPHTRLFASVAYQLSTTLPKYHEILDQAILHDKTLVTKNMSSQFNSLIVNPLRELQARGHRVERRPIIIDGLDECKSADAQCEIIEIIAESVRNRTTPFRWAFFSRAEPHIEATFSKASIVPLCRTAVLEVSRSVDGDIEIYLRGGLKNIIRRRKISTTSPWPTDRDIRILVEASAGLFIFAATVLRFIEDSRSLWVEKPLYTVLDIIAGRTSSTATPFTEIDALYTLIMQRVPNDILPSVLLLFGNMLLSGYIGSWSAILEANCLGFSEAEFKSLCTHVQAVLCYRGAEPLARFGSSVDITRPFNSASARILRVLQQATFRAGGTVSFYHKSFYDFLCDPSRSGAFCANTPEILAKLFYHLRRRHHDYSHSFVIRDNGLDLTPGFPNSAASLVWPYPNPSNELANSHLKAGVFNNIDALLFCLINADGLELELAKGILEVDHRKTILNRSRLFKGLSIKSYAYGAYRISRSVHGSTFRYVPPTLFSQFDLKTFRRVIEHRTKLNLIRPYYPTFLSKCKTYFTPRPSREEPYFGLYIVGRGSKSYFWYWKIDLSLGYYFEFESCDLSEARRIYRKERGNLLEFFLNGERERVD